MQRNEFNELEAVRWRHTKLDIREQDEHRDSEGNDKLNSTASSQNIHFDKHQNEQ